MLTLMVFLLRVSHAKRQKIGSKTYHRHLFEGIYAQIFSKEPFLLEKGSPRLAVASRYPSKKRFDE